jgi:hypothetical protein
MTELIVGRLVDEFAAHVAQTASFAEDPKAGDRDLLAGSTWDTGLVLLLKSLKERTIDKKLNDVLELFWNSARIHHDTREHNALAATCVAEAAVADFFRHFRARQGILDLGYTWFDKMQNWGRRDIIADALKTENLIAFWLNRWGNFDLALTSVYELSVLTAVRWILTRMR